MAHTGGRGPRPKDPDKRARTNSDPVPLRKLPLQVGEQPELPEFVVDVYGERTPFVWPEQTREWWRMWRESPLSSEFTATDWSELRDTAVIHAKFWQGDLKQAAELRLRVAKFGATPEDRARLRIVFAQADDADAGKGTQPTGGKGTARQRYRGLALGA